MGYISGGVSASYLSNQWDDTVEFFEDLNASDGDIIRFERIRNATGAAAVSSFIVA